jgi:protocatechuate 3,4-dioxygenase beta subunit
VLQARSGIGLLVAAVGVILSVGLHSSAQQPQQVRPQQPARDTSAIRRPAVGTARVTGRVVAADSGRPLRRARVVLSGPGGTQAVQTDENGQYDLTNLPAGQYSITAAREGYLSLSYGQRTWVGPAGRLQLADRQQVRDVDFRLPRGGIITGHVFDESGEPLIRANVRVLRSMYVSGERRLATTGTDSTDDRGEYRVFGLRPGTYYVTATARNDAVEERLTAAGSVQVDPVVGYAPTYYPTVGSVADAVPIVVGPSQEVTGIDFGVLQVRVAEVSGIVGVPPGVRASVSLVADGGESAESRGASVAADGTFRIRSVPPGRYLLVARAMADQRGRQAAGPATQLFAVQPVIVNGQPVGGLALVLTTGGIVSGSVSFEATTQPPPNDLTSVRVTAAPVGTVGFGPSNSVVRADGTFIAGNVPPVPVLLRAVVGAGWQLKAVYVGGRDITETPIEVKVNEPTVGVSIVFTDVTSEVNGTVRDRQGQPVSACQVAIFPADSLLWRQPQSRRMRAVTSDSDGHFALRGLPAGQYLVHPLDEVDPAQWTNPELLEYLRSSATPVALSDGETKSVDLKVRG